MKIADILDRQAILPEINADSKKEVIERIVDLACKVCPDIDGKEEIIKILMEREKLKSTGIEDGLAIPHAKHVRIKKMIGLFARSRAGVDYDSMDGKPTHFFFLLLAPDMSTGEHLKTLARISRMFKDSAFKQKLLETGDPDLLYRLIIEQEEQRIETSDTNM